MATLTPEASATPEGVFSILDTDLYKLTMQCAIRKFYPDTTVSYRFTNRTPHLKLSNEAFAWLEAQLANLSNLALTPDELAYLRKTCSYLEKDDYLTSFLPSFRFDPTSHLNTKFTPDENKPGHGDLEIEVHGLWRDTILYEIPVLALVSEAYFRFADTDWTYDGQEEKAYQKGLALVKGGANFAEFGTRRRRDYKTQDLVMRGLVRAHKELHGSATQQQEELLGNLSGTGNVHFAMKHGFPPVGTMAHEWFMAIAAATQDYKNANGTALSNWVEHYGRGVLSIALTDTFGTPAFLKSFANPIPERLRGLSEGWIQNPPTISDVFAGTRQDSGDPKKFIKLMQRFYESQGLPKNHGKKIMFSDSLTVDSALLYKRLAEKRGFAPSFGIGTFMTNDFTKASNPSEKSKPMNNVIKVFSANGKPAIKLSDDLGKHTGDVETVKMAKEVFGYVDKHWDGADEADRYGKGVEGGGDLSDSEDDDTKA